jgi:hypothetical protein
MDAQEPEMLSRPGPFYVSEIARAVARRPGRAEVDHDEACRIADDMAEWYLRGEFGDAEVVAYTGPPPSLRSLAEIKEDARRRGENWCLSQPEWRAAYMLTAAAARRYLERCGFTGALRVLMEWFGVENRPDSRRGKPGRPPVVRQRLTEQMLVDLRSERRTVEQLEADTLAVLVAQYGGSQNTANDARRHALAIFRDSEIESEK